MSIDINFLFCCCQIFVVLFYNFPFLLITYLQKLRIFSVVLQPKYLL